MFTKNDDIEWELNSICVCTLLDYVDNLKITWNFQFSENSLLVIENESHIFQINDQKFLLYMYMELLYCLLIRLENVAF